MLGKILALTCALLWAFAVILFKRAGDSIRPLALNWYKTALTSLVLSPFLFAHGLDGFSRSDLVAVLTSGILGIALADTLFFIALDRLGASLAGIVD
ncbi:MAG TPA: DMT family transporter, partial [Holophaga sp.]|nr:DMT family transporter [Holophaga sp.]